MIAAAIFVTFFVLIILGMPIAMALAFGAIVPMQFVMDMNLMMVAQKMFTSMDVYSLMTIPFFLIAGGLMDKGGVSARIVSFATSLVGWMPGHLAVITFAASAFFGAISGSATATVAAIGSIMLPSMLKQGYALDFSLATIASAGILGTIIPPSISFVIYGMATGASIGDMFLAGWIPGLMLTGAMSAYGIYYGKKHLKDEVRVKFSLRNVGKSFIQAFWALLMPVIILGGIYAGICTATESAAVSILYGVLVGTFVYKELTFKLFLQTMKESIRTSAMIMFIIATATVFSYVMTMEQLPTKVAQALFTMSGSELVFLALVTILLFGVGMIMDTQPAVLILSPILLISAKAFGIDGIAFGVIMCVNLAIGLLTPPVGINLYVAASVAGVPVKKTFSRHLIIYILLACAVLISIMVFQELITFLPSLVASM